MIHFTSQFNINPLVSFGDKSISHRALILSAIASGKSTICNLSLCDDVLTTANCLRALGAQIKIDGKLATVTPITQPNDNVVLDCKNSGTTARLLAGVVAGLGITAKFVGDQSLQKRPMDRVIEPLRELGADICKCNDGLFIVRPSKLVGKVLRAKVNSAQVKSAVLLAGLFAEGTTQYVEDITTRNHTELLLKHCGIDATDCSVTKSTPQPLDVTIPNDISSASYLLALALLTNSQVTLPNVGVNDGRVGFLTVLKNAKASLVLANERIEAGEKVADICIKKGKIFPLFASKTDVVNAIDEIPILSAIAIATQGAHVFCEVGELRHKECDRIQAIIDMANVCGQTATFDGKNLTITSNGILPTSPTFASHNDHRIAMCGAVLAIACGGGTVDSFPVEISFTEFLQAIGASPKRFCVIGAEVSNSLSPKLMMHLASQSNVCCSYDAVSLDKDISNEQLLDVINSFDGVNVTIPFKRRVANLLQAKSPTVNTVGKNVAPQSTDGYGVEMALKLNGIDVAGKSLWIVGAGGGAEACVQHFAGKCQMQIVNRTKANSDYLTQKYNLSTDISAPFGVLSFVPECEFEQSIELPQGCRFVFVSAYNGVSGLKAQAQKRGVPVIEGMQMLYYQGAKSFSLWTSTPLQSNFSAFENYLKRQC